VRLDEIDPPTIGPDEVLLEVHAAGLDRGVWHVMTGKPYLIRVTPYGGLSGPKHPVPGSDVAGRVVAVGEAVTRFAVGDEVFGIGRGTYAVYATAKEAKLVRKPAGISFEQAGVAAISGITALQALTTIGRLEPGNTVLVIGASGGVGSYAVQIAKALGGVVTGVASTAKLDLVRSLGAEHVIDYTTTDYLDGTSRYDLVIDIGGSNPIRRLRRALTPRGTLVIVGGEGGDTLTGIGRQLRAAMLSPFVGQRLTFFLSAERTEDIQRLADVMAEGSVVPAVGSRYPLDQAPQAIADLEAGRVRGKAVVVVRESDES
jgi:NADPH:quinone reductase-like Zn-dependent oxidoreductase